MRIPPHRHTLGDLQPDRSIGVVLAASIPGGTHADGPDSIGVRPASGNNGGYERGRGIRGTASRDLRERSFGPATAMYRELGTLGNLLAFNAVNTQPTRNFTAATFAEAPKLAAEELHTMRGGRPQQLCVLLHRL